MPEGGIGTEQQEVGTLKRASHILQGRVQLKCMPEGGIGTEQQEVGTLKRASHILQGRVQHTRHASRPQEGPGDHRNDSAQGQATTSVFLGGLSLHLNHFIA